jgi:twitching motility protein PilT
MVLFANIQDNGEKAKYTLKELQMEIDRLLKLVIEKKASDLHLDVGSPPVLRINGVLLPQEDIPPFTHQDVQTIFERVTTLEQREKFMKEMELDFAYSFFGLARFRVNVLRQRGSVSLAFRVVPVKISTIDELELPQICKKIILKKSGLILVTGHSGAGKSTTQAAMIDYLNQNARRHIITIEDPIEFLYSNNKCMIVQRDLGDDTKSFDAALTHALRHDPDVIVLGEMRDLSTIATALRAAETGHLVVGTLHTTNAVGTVNRVIDIFPAHQQDQIRQQLAETLEAVLSQTLVNRISGGRIGVFEILLANSGVRNVIREGKSHELYSLMQLGAQQGMRTMDDALAELVGKYVVTLEEALTRCAHPDQMRKLFENPTLGKDRTPVTSKK